MTQQYLFGFLVLLACFCFEAASRPSNNESSDNLKVEVPIEYFQPSEGEERALPDDERPFEIQEAQEENTQEILDKIKSINNQLKKPQRPQVNFNIPPFVSGGYILDKAILEKIQQIIASGKLNGLSSAQKVQAVNTIASENSNLNKKGGYSRALQFAQPIITNNVLSGNSVALVPMPYVTQLPVVVMPTGNVYPVSNDINNIQSTAEYSTRQRPSLPFQIQWPLAPFFPVLIKDPLLHYLQGGTWENLVDYGQNADVCNRKQKSTDEMIKSDEEQSIDENQTIQNDDSVSIDPIQIYSSRQGRKMKNIKKRTVSKSAPSQLLTQQQTIPKGSPFQQVQNIQNLFKPTQKPKTTQKPQIEVDEDETDLSAAEGDLRFPFGDFTWGGNRKPVAPSPGFFINRLKVRKGGVAIAGPGGIATAGRGGAAIVGPGGLAYTQPGGLAVAGPQAKVIALSTDTDLNSVVTRLRQVQEAAQYSSDSSVPRLLQAIPEGKVVATGPIIYYHPYTS